MGSDADDAGLFWTTFGGSLGTAAGASALEQLLQSSDCSLEALLDEEDVIQEFKAGNEQLVSRLSEPSAVKALLEFVTCEPAEQATSKRCYRYPFVAVELMTCAPDQFFQAVVKQDQLHLLDTLWSFLEATPPAEVNPVLAGYFSRTAALIFSKRPSEVVEYLRTRGADALLERFLERLHLRSLAELFARLLCAEQPSQSLFPVEGLVARLLGQLKEQGPSGETQEHVTLVILELLAQKDSLCFGDDFLRQLTASSSVTFLVDHAFSGSPGSVAAATDILSNIVIHTYVALKGISVCASTPTLSPLSPPSLPSAEDCAVNVGTDDPTLGETAPPRVERSPPRSPKVLNKVEGAATWLEARSSQLMRELCAQLPRLRALLDEALGRTAALRMPSGDIRSVGSRALEAVMFLAMLARTGCVQVLEALLREQLLPRCLELFFCHPWSSLLHNAVRLLLSEVLNAPEGIRPELVLWLLHDGGLLERVIAEYREEGLELGGAGRDGAGGGAGGNEHGKPPRVGYMGHLHAMCSELRDYGARVPECGAALLAAEGWSQVVLPAIDATQRAQSEKLGGDISAEERGLASSGGCNTLGSSQPKDAVRSSLDADFMLDDLSDLDEHSIMNSSAVPRCPQSGDRLSSTDLFDPETFPSSTGTLDATAVGSPTVLPVLVSRGSEGEADLAHQVDEPFQSGQQQPWVADFEDAVEEKGLEEEQQQEPKRGEQHPGVLEEEGIRAVRATTSTQVSEGSNAASTAPFVGPGRGDELVQRPGFSDRELEGASGSGQGEFGSSAAKAVQPHPGDASSVGAENLFALLGEDTQAQAAQPAWCQNPARSVDPSWPTGSRPAPEAIKQVDSSAFVATGRPDAFANNDLFVAFANNIGSAATPTTCAATKVDLSCLADFDPLFQPSVDPMLASNPPLSRSAGMEAMAAPTGSTDLDSLAPFWSSSSS